MDSARESTLVIDFSVLPIRPDVGKVKHFLEDQMKINYEHVKSIQLHNTRNCALIGVTNKEVALRYQSEHNGKRVIVCKEKEYKIPVYVDSEAVVVRIHDLPTTISHSAVHESMLKYGEVISIRNEAWKHYFPGISNGVLVLRMNLLQHIPSYITIGKHNTMVTYCNQPKICRRCHQTVHPKKTCQEANITIATVTSPITSNDEIFNQVDFPPINNIQKPSSPATMNKPAAEERPQNDDEWTDIENNDSYSSSEYTEVTNKRRRSKRIREKDAKKTCTDQCFLNAEQIEIVEKVKKILGNKNGKGSSTSSSIN